MNLVFASDDVVWVSWKYGAEEVVLILRHTNEVIGAYVTAGARIHLYRYLDRLRENAIYCDTDSVIYKHPMGEPQLIETGNKFMHMGSELHPNQIMSEFPSGGPKNYEYSVLHTVTRDCQTVYNVRGIYLNSYASNLVKFEVISNMILEGNKGNESTMVNVHNEKKNKRTKKGSELYLLLTNMKINCIEFNFSSGVGQVKIRASRLGINRGGLVGDRDVS